MNLLLTLFLRREPTTDPLALRLSSKRRAKCLDVVAYSSLEDAAKRSAKARWPHYATSTKPTRRNDRVTLNCYEWEVCWLPDAV